jgi:hypothetical protein
MRLDQRPQPTPRHNRIHLRQEQIPPRLFRGVYSKKKKLQVVIINVFR